MQIQCRNHKTSKTSYAIQVTKEILIRNQFAPKKSIEDFSLLDIRKYEAVVQS